MFPSPMMVFNTLKDCLMDGTYSIVLLYSLGQDNRVLAIVHDSWERYLSMKMY